VACAAGCCVPWAHRAIVDATRRWRLELDLALVAGSWRLRAWARLRATLSNFQSNL
jgi:hypothetical protein